MEIERKFLIDCNKLPFKLEDYPFKEIIQAYISSDPTIRIRKSDNDYILTIKNLKTVNSQNIDQNEQNHLSREEHEFVLTEYQYRTLLQKTEGIQIKKQRYLIPSGKYVIELDKFFNEYEGLYFAEVEFLTAEEAFAFQAPDWFGEDVSGRIEYSNSYLSMNKTIDT